MLPSHAGLSVSMSEITDSYDTMIMQVSLLDIINKRRYNPVITRDRVMMLPVLIWTTHILP